MYTVRMWGFDHFIQHTENELIIMSKHISYLNSLFFLFPLFLSLSLTSHTHLSHFLSILSLSLSLSQGRGGVCEPQQGLQSEFCGSSEAEWSSPYCWHSNKINSTRVCCCPSIMENKGTCYIKISRRGNRHYNKGLTKYIEFHRVSKIYTCDYYPGSGVPAAIF